MSVFRNRFNTHIAGRALSTQTQARHGALPSARDMKYYSPYNAGAGAPDPHSMKHPVESTNSSPLSALSNSALMRSLLINSISSKPFLLGPAISLMSFLCQPKRSFLVDVNRNKPLAGLVKKLVYKQFCAGESGREVKETLRTFKSMGFRGTIVTYAKETVFDYNTKVVHDFGIEKNTNADKGLCPNIEIWRQGVHETIEMLGEGDQLAIKTTGAGPVVTDALAAGDPLPKQMFDALRDISLHCKRRQVRILIDAESQAYQGGILKAGLDLMREFNRDGYALVYNTYQAYLKNATSTIEHHLKAAFDENFTLGLKLVRGAYLATEQRSLICDTKKDTDNAYNAIAHGALRRQIGNIGAEGCTPFPSVNLMLCGHNKESVFSSYELHQQRLKDGLSTVPVGFAQLHGMTDAVSFGLLRLGSFNDSKPEVYKCSTWGSVTECLGYLTRRALENKDAAGRTLDEYVALKLEAKRRLASFLFPYSQRSPKGITK